MKTFRCYCFLFYFILLWTPIYFLLQEQQVYRKTSQYLLECLQISLLGSIFMIEINYS